MCEKDFDYAKIAKVLEEMVEAAYCGCLGKTELSDDDKKNLQRYYSPEKQNLYCKTTLQKMLFHAQNRQGMNGINFEKDINSFFDGGFDVKDFKNKKTLLLSKKDKEDKNYWEFYIEKTGQGIVDYIDELNKSTQKDMNDFKEYKKYIKEMEKEELIERIEKIPGFGPALTRDFLKEAGRVDMIKPDVHIETVFKDVFNVSNPEDIDKKAKEVADAIGWTVYKLDKVIYLICTRNYNFYPVDSDNKESLNTARDRLIEYLRNAVKIGNNDGKQTKILQNQRYFTASCTYAVKTSRSNNSGYTTGV